MKWHESNLIPTVTEGDTVHAVIVQRKRIVSLCETVSTPTDAYAKSWRTSVACVLDGLLNWVNCRQCLREAERDQPEFWIGLSPTAFRTQPNHPDRFISEMSRRIEATKSTERRDLWLILADYFDERCDPRGEFIRLQVAISSKPDFLDYDHPLRHAQFVNAMWRVEDAAFSMNGG